MCWDKTVKRACAVKVMQAKTSQEHYKQEVGFLAELSKNGGEVSVEEAYKNHLAVPQEHFWHVGPNGRHLCIVMPVLGPSIDLAKAFEDVNLLKDVCSQISRGLAFLHSKGMAHGDLHHNNILLQSTLSELSKPEIDHLLMKNSYWPEDLFAEGEDGPGPYAPRQIYDCWNWIEVDPKYIKKEIAIIDFGKSFQAAEPPGHQTVSGSLRAPEQFFGFKPSQASDLWAFGYTLMYILGSYDPFKRLAEGKTKTWDLIPSWEDALGPLPEPYRAKIIEKIIAASSKDAARKRKYEEIDASESVFSPEQLARAKQSRLDRSGTADVIFERLALPNCIPVLPSE